MSSQASAEVFVRWDQSQIPPPHALGISTIVVPAAQAQAIRTALGQGYRVYVEVDAAAAGTFETIEGVAGVIVKGSPRPGQLARLSRLASSVRVADDRGKWPHIRTNWVTRNKDVLQVTNRSSQPWLESNGALVSLARERAAADGPPVLLTYVWQPVTVSDLDQGPRLENYLVAIAEAGSFGADLLLPLHERFERALVLGRPEARSDWEEIRRFLDFYAWNVPGQHQPIANVGVVTADPMRSFEVMNLLARHNLPFLTVTPGAVAAHRFPGLDLLIVLEDLDEAARRRVAQFASDGGTVIGKESAPADPNTFALRMRQLLGADRRVVDVWNGITVMVAPYATPAGDRMVLSAMNYAAQPLPIQVRVRGTFSDVQYEAPGQRAVLLPFEHRNGGTEFVLPALRIGARVFLNRFP